MSRRVLMGLCKGQETVHLINNNKQGEAWRLVSFDIYGKKPNEMGTLLFSARLALSMEGLNTPTSTGAGLLDFDRDQVIAIQTIPTGDFVHTILDDTAVVTSDLFIQNCTGNGLYYKVELEQFKITPDRQVLLQLKQSGQNV